VLFVHAAPSALCPHVEWAAAGVFGVPPQLSWTAQPAARGEYRAELSWEGPAGTAARLTSALRGWERLRFEVTEEGTPATEAERYAYTPTLGVFRAVVGPHGDILVPEDRLRTAVARATAEGSDLAVAIDRLLGRPWDDELEPFRRAGDGAPVRWLHQVV
jgi:hypothetical protein